MTRFLQFLLWPLRRREAAQQARRDHELALARLQVQANQEIALAVTSALQGVVSDAFQLAKSQQELQAKWLDALTPKGEPFTSVVREEDEAEWAEERAKVLAAKEGFSTDAPTSTTPADTMAWLAQTISDDEAQYQTFSFGP